MTSFWTWVDLSLHKRSSTIAKLAETTFALLNSVYSWSPGFKTILPLLPLSSQTLCFLAWIFLFPVLSSLVKTPLSGSIHIVPKLQMTKTTTSRNGSGFKPEIQKLCSSLHARHAPKPLQMPKQLLSHASTTKSLPARAKLLPIVLPPPNSNSGSSSALLHTSQLFCIHFSFHF